MSSPQHLSRSLDYLGGLAKELGDLQGPQAVIGELVQNADDAPDATSMAFVVAEDGLRVRNDGEFASCDDVASGQCEWIETRGHRCDFHSFRSVASADKRSRPETTGAFGIGFTSVYQLTDRPELLSTGERWVVDESQPEHERITRYTDVETSGTEFFLPWARDKSRLRSALRQPVIDDAYISSITQALVELVPAAMPFLRKLETVEIETPELSLRYERSKEGELVTVAGSDGTARRWVVLEGTGGDGLAELSRQHPEMIDPDRSTSVRVAFEIGESARPGRFHASLPTEQATGLPFSVDASFFPASDRKRIRFDDAPEGRWSKALVESAAQLLAASLSRLPDLIGDALTVETVLAAHSLTQRPGADGVASRWWEELADRIPESEIIPTVHGTRCAPKDVRLWSSDEAELAAAALLRGLGIDLVAPSVRAKWFEAISAGIKIPVLRLRDLTSVLNDASAPQDLSTWDETDLVLLWVLLEHQLATPNLRAREVIEELRQECRVLPATDGSFHPPSRLLRSTDGTVALLVDAGVDHPMLAHHRVHRHSQELVALVREVTPVEMAKALEAAFGADSVPSGFDRLRALEWFDNRREGLGDGVRGRIVRLPIVPAGGSFHALDELTLPPEGFTDPLGLAKVVDLEKAHRFRVLLEDLGASPLTVPRYCVEFLPPAFESGLDADRRWRLLETLVEHLSKVEEDPESLAALRALPLVKCDDGEWRQASDVYAGDFSHILGKPHPVATVSGQHAAGLRRLFGLLGVASKPRIEDIRARVESLARRPKDLVAAAIRLFEHLSTRFITSPDEFEHSFGFLQSRSWLPAVKKSPTSFKPAEVHSVFRQNLFASQGNFLDIPTALQRQTTAFLTWLGVESEPTVGQVVRHLLHLRDQAQEPTHDLWAYLALHAEDPAVSTLRHERFIATGSGAFVAAESVFWGESTFGRHRWRLPESLRPHQALFDQLGVAEHPGAEDALSVLGEIAVDHGGENAPLRADDRPVVYACWALLDRELRSGTIGADDLVDLGTTECVLDRDHVPRCPKEVLFADSSAVVSKFDDDARCRLIDRPADVHHALEAAGVRHLRDRVESTIVERNDLPGVAALEEVIRGRRDLFRRVLASADDAGTEAFDRFLETVRIVPLSSLRVVEEVQIGTSTFKTAGIDRDAFFRPLEAELLVVERGGGARSWSEVSRELLRAMSLSDALDPADAAAISVVLGAPDETSAAAELDSFGFGRLADAVDTTGSESPEVRVGEESGSVDPTDIDLGSDDPPSGSDTEGEKKTGVGGEETAHEDPGPGGSEDEPAGERTGAGTGAGSGERGSPGSGGDETGGRERGSGGSESGSSKGGGQNTSAPRERLRSYVTPVGSGDEDTDEHADSHVRRVERAAVDAVLAHERSQGRDPVEMPYGNHGYDIESSGADGQKRYIEVKGTAHEWDPQGVAISDRQFLEAQRRREEFWLYVVETADTKPILHRLQDPASRIVQYFFDDQWRGFAERDTAASLELPDLGARADRKGMRNAVAIHDLLTGDACGEWVDLRKRLTLVTSGAFAMQIAGNSLGMAYRGGLAIARPAESVDADDLVVVRLSGQVDPDTGLHVTVRFWRPELAMDGTEIALRLASDGSVEPLTVQDRDGLEIIGVVTDRLRPDEVY